MSKNISYMIRNGLTVLLESEIHQDETIVKNEDNLKYSLKLRKWDISVLLLSYGANINLSDDRYDTYIDKVIVEQNIDILKFLLQNQADLSSQSLLHAIKSGNVASVAMLTHTSITDECPILFAIKLNDLTMVEQLIKLGMCPKINTLSYTIDHFPQIFKMIWIACANNNYVKEIIKQKRYRIVRYLCEVDLILPEYSVVRMAIVNRDIKMIRLLLEHYKHFISECLGLPSPILEIIKGDYNLIELFNTINITDSQLAIPLTMAMKLDCYDISS